MLLIRTRLQPSKIHGLGVFAAQPVKQGDMVWRFMPGFDQLIHPRLIEALDQDFVETYMQRCETTGLWLFCVDNARFINHADHPSTTPGLPLSNPGAFDVAARDLDVGDELTQDYRLGEAQPFRGFGRLPPFGAPFTTDVI